MLCPVHGTDSGDRIRRGGDAGTFHLGLSGGPCGCRTRRLDPALRRDGTRSSEAESLGRGNSGEVAVLIPSIDLMGGKIVQLVQGEKKALEFDDFEEWIARFANYPMVQLIDLDAALGTSDNRDLVREFARRLPCQVGGGVRSIETAEQMLSNG